MSEWRPIATAPRDGTPVQAMIPGEGSDFIIRWEGGFVGEDWEEHFAWVMAHEQEPPECWTDGVCWGLNADGIASTQPTHWMPLASPTAQEGED